MARERERIEQELQVASQIQQALLPEATPQLDGWQLTIYYEPARKVGGDFYDFLAFEACVPIFSCEPLNFGESVHAPG